MIGTSPAAPGWHPAPLTCVRLKPRTRVAPYSYPLDPPVFVWSPFVLVGLHAIMPNGAVPPGHVLPPRLDPMNGSTYRTVSAARAGPAATAGVKLITDAPSDAVSAATATTAPVRVTSIFHLR
jgi:hypothetical protein